MKRLSLFALAAALAACGGSNASSGSSSGSTGAHGTTASSTTSSSTSTGSSTSSSTTTSSSGSGSTGASSGSSGSLGSSGSSGSSGSGTQGYCGACTVDSDCASGACVLDWNSNGICATDCSTTACPAGATCQTVYGTNQQAVQGCVPDPLLCGVDLDGGLPDAGSATVVGTYSANPNLGGPVLSTPNLVTITWADPRASTLEAFGTFLVGSNWLATVGPEYGIGNATAQAYRIQGAPPATFPDSDIPSLINGLISDGGLPLPTGTPSQNLYMLYVPTTMELKDSQGGNDCNGFLGYHDQASYDGSHYAYAVILDCPPSFYATQSLLEVDTATASHEFMEAATDPLPNSAPAYSESSYDEAWYFEGGELADRCNDAYMFESGWSLQRIWSNAGAASGGATCVPVPAGAQDLNVFASQDTAFPVTAGQTVQIPLTGRSLNAVPDWYLEVYDEGQDFNTSPALSSRFINNGGQVTLTLTVPANASAGSYGVAQVYSLPLDGSADVGIYPVMLKVQ